MQENQNSTIWRYFFVLLAVLWVGVYASQFLLPKSEKWSTASAGKKTPETDDLADKHADIKSDPSDAIGFKEQSTDAAAPIQISAQPISTPPSFGKLVQKEPNHFLLSSQKNSAKEASGSATNQLKNYDEDSGSVLAANPLGDLLAKDGPFIPKDTTITSPFGDLQPILAKNQQKKSPSQMKDNLQPNTLQASSSGTPKITRHGFKNPVTPIKTQPISPAPVKRLHLPPLKLLPTDGPSNTLVEVFDEPEQNSDSLPTEKKLQSAFDIGAPNQVAPIKKNTTPTKQPSSSGDNNQFQIELETPKKKELTLTEDDPSKLDLDRMEGSLDLQSDPIGTGLAAIEPKTIPEINSTPGLFVTPKSLLSNLSDIQKVDPRLDDWRTLTEETLRSLNQKPTGFDSPKPSTTISELAAFLNHWMETRTQDSLDQENALRTFSDKLNRQSAIWQLALAANSTDSIVPPADGNLVTYHHDRINDAWKDYLLWNQAALIGRGLDRRREKEISRDVLNRYFNPALNFKQAAIVKESIPQESLKTLSRLAQMDFETSTIFELLEATEGMESVDVLPSNSLNEIGRRLEVSSNINHQKLGKLLNKTYRQANLKVEFSEDFVNQWFYHQRWYAKLLGKAHSRFVSAKSSPLKLQILPCSDGIKIELKGKQQSTINSDGWKPSGRNTGQGNLGQGSPGHESLGQSNLGRMPNVEPAANSPYYSKVAMNLSSFGSSPLARSTQTSISLPEWLSQQYQPNTQSVPYLNRPAPNHSSFRQAGTAAYRIGDQGVQIISASGNSEKIAKPTKENLSKKISSARNFVGKWFGSLEAAGLEPKIMSASSDNRSIQTSFRIGDHRQTCGTETSFQTPKDAVLSIQIHQSLVSNILDRCQLAGKSFDWDSFCTHLESVIHRQDNAETETTRSYGPQFEFTFAEKRPVVVRFDRKGTKITLRLKTLSIPNSDTKALQSFENVHLNFYLKMDIEQWQVGWVIDPERSVECHFYHWDNSAQGLSKKEVATYSEKICSYIGRELTKPFFANFLPLKSIPESYRSKLEVLPVKQGRWMVTFFPSVKRRRGPSIESLQEFSENSYSI